MSTTPTSGAVRRALLLAVAALAALPLTAPSDARANVVWKSDASRPLLEEWASFTSASPSRFAQTTRTGRRAYRIDLVDGDQSYIYGDASPSAVAIYGGPYGERAELGQGNPATDPRRLFHEGEERWISWQVLVPSGYPATPSNWNIVFQFKQLGGLMGPAHDMKIWKGRTPGVYEWEWESISGATDVWPTRRGGGVIQTDRWVRFTAHVRFSADPAKGFLELRGDPARAGDMRVLVPKTSHATLKRATGDVLDPGGAPVPGHVRLGIYRDPAIAGNASLWYSGVTVATTRTSAESSAFGTTTKRATTARAARAQRTRENRRRRASSGH